MMLGQVTRMDVAVGAPTGFAECAGQLMRIDQNTALFSIIGTNFGGDGKTTFELPNLPVDSGPKYFIALIGHYPQFE